MDTFLEQFTPELLWRIPTEQRKKEHEGCLQSLETVISPVEVKSNMADGEGLGLAVLALGACLPRGYRKAPCSDCRMLAGMAKGTADWAAQLGTMGPRVWVGKQAEYPSPSWLEKTRINGKRGHCRDSQIVHDISKQD
ncbi:hypothetical protein EYF80_000768 [Liparis tanakae]|uniref:Uncharacterized protein n=1 Tax=Liparis tanakae TaxID=230148 RepID=A0A4Z2JFD7_9TELE|nr:hypothetical protein EYF80_000768 [Liparis tanakae]